jgi:hypothetical protein
MNRGLFYVFCGALIIAAGVASCGGGGDSGKTGGTPATGGTTSAGGATGGITGAGGAIGGTGGTASTSPWDAGRISNTGTDWWINARRGTYYFAVKLQNSYEEDLAGKAAAIEFANAVAAKIGAGTATPSIGTLVPAANEVGGWTLDPDNSKTSSGPAVATTHAKAEEYIDGSAAPFYTASYSATAFAWENYVKASYPLELTIWQMASSADATQVYSDLLKLPLYKAPTWSDL